MKKTYFIGFFCCVIVLGFVYLSAYYYTVTYLSDAPVKLKSESEVKESEQTKQPVKEQEVAKVGDDNSEAVFVDTNDKPKVQAGTEYIVEEYDLNQYTLMEKTEEIPFEYIGLTREELIGVIEDYCNYPTEEDLNAGFESLKLVSFSEEKVIVRKSFRPIELPESFYLVVENHYVSVYCDDKKTIYMYTGIALDSLPEDIQKEVLAMKYIASIEELYGFLETYSS
ncbi:MAG TPA: hypothetical protein VJZ01_06875 [Lachnospiraceae bacterium]|nr:hypothetical protein [Lachnospiraceae bacterium]